MSRFFFHFNKPQSKQAGRPQISVHIHGKCHIVDNVDVRVRTWGRIRKQQPKFVIVGDCDNYEINNGTMLLTKGSASRYSDNG